MNDFDKAANRVGNRFDLVLIASERMREIHRKRREQEQLKLLTVEQRRKNVVPSSQAISDIENGIVGREYLGRVKSRSRQKRVKFDEI
jgi:DNA-directed RNA polymerase omega subunit